MWLEVVGVRKVTRDKSQLYNKVKQKVKESKRNLLFTGGKFWSKQCPNDLNYTISCFKSFLIALGKIWKECIFDFSGVLLRRGSEKWVQTRSLSYKNFEGKDNFQTKYSWRQSLAIVLHIPKRVSCG